MFFLYCTLFTFTVPSCPIIYLSLKPSNVDWTFAGSLLPLCLCRCCALTSSQTFLHTYQTLSLFSLTTTHPFHFKAFSLSLISSNHCLLSQLITHCTCSCSKLYFKRDNNLAHVYPFPIHGLIQKSQILLLPRERNSILSIIINKKSEVTKVQIKPTVKIKCI